MTTDEFRRAVAAGIPDELPAPKPYDESINHAPRRKKILTPEQERLALRNALRYFPAKHHAVLAPEFADELRRYGRTCTASGPTTTCTPVPLATIRRVPARLRLS